MNEKLYCDFVEYVSDWIWEVDRDGVITFSNRRVSETLGYLHSEIVGKPIFDFMSAQEADKLKYTFSSYLNDSLRKDIKNRFKHRNGHEVTNETNGSPIMNQEGEYIGYHGVSRDLNIQKQAQLLGLSNHKSEKDDIHLLSSFGFEIPNEKEVEQQLLHDFLTNLPNRRYLHHELTKIMTKPAQDQKTALLFIDLDNFKQINDSLGHLSGDRLLKMVANRLRICVREKDFICRFGGDEFIILLKDIQKIDEVNQIVHQITRTLNKPFYAGTHSVQVTGSVGVSIYPDQAQDAETLIKTADQEMYQIKWEKKGYFDYGIRTSDIS